MMRVLAHCGTVPQHVGIIMDGNRTYYNDAAANSKRFSLPDDIYEIGRENAQRQLEWCQMIGIPEITLFVLSTANLVRNQQCLTKIFAQTEILLHWLGEKKSTYKVIGRMSKLPTDSSIRALCEKINMTTDLNIPPMLPVVNLAVAYSGKEQIVDGVFEILKMFKNRDFRDDVCLVKSFEDIMRLNGTSDVDLMIRTSNHKRLSDFLNWQAGCCFIYFSSEYWPSFSIFDLAKAVLQYQWIHDFLSQYDNLEH